MTTYESVLSVDDYYDGPREGIALFRGQRYRFRSRMFDVYAQQDDTLDVFDLTPIDDASGEAITAHGEFKVASDAPAEAPGTLRKLVVRWTPTPS